MEKPKVQLTGQNGNVFNLIGICKRALLENGQGKESVEMANKCVQSKSYEEALAIMAEYCEVS